MTSQSNESLISCSLPRVTIQFCTQCKWMLRAAYFAQELLSTFSLSIGEVALQPSTGGTFIITIYTSTPSAASANASSSEETSLAAAVGGAGAGGAGGAEPQLRAQILWDRKIDGGFPETKELKRRVRDVIDPGRNLGHIDGHKKQQQQQDEPPHITTAPGTSEGDRNLTPAGQDGTIEKKSCEDCV